MFRPVDLVVQLALWLGLWGLAATGSFALFDGRLFDAFVRIAPGDPESSVAILRVPAGRLEATAASAIALGAEGVIRLPAVDEPSYRRGSDDASGCRPETVDGIVRALPLLDGDGRRCPLAEAAAAAGWRLPDDERLVPDFRRRTSTAIPQLDASALGGAAAEVALAGRWALLVEGDDAPTFVTPLYATDGLLEPSVVQALLLDGVARSRELRWLPAWTSVLAAILLLATLHAGLRHGRYRTMLLSIVAAVPVTLALHALVLHLTGSYVPPSPTLLALGAYAVGIVLRRNKAMERVLVDLEHRLTGVVGEPIAHGLDIPEDVAWEQVNRFLVNYFDLKRSLILELPAGGTHLRAMAAHGCSADDIVEMRRDYRRPPYSTALAHRVPIPPARRFLPEIPGTIDFLAPLVAAEELVGFWGFTVAVPEDDAEDAIAVEAGRYAQEVAKVILRRSGHQPEPARGGMAWPMLAGMRARLLDGAGQAAEQLAAYRDIFAAIGHPVAVCSLMGRIQFTNPAMEAFLTGLGINARTVTLIELLVGPCRVSTAAAKASLRDALQGGESRAILKVDRDGGGEFVVVLRSIARRSGKRTDNVLSLFDALGLIVEILPDAAAERADPRAEDDGFERTLRRLVADRAGALQAKRLGVAIAVGAGVVVDAPSTALQALLASVLDLCIDDAAPDGAIRLAADPAEGGRLRLRVEAEGFGMPAGHVADVMLNARPSSGVRPPSALERVALAAAALQGRVPVHVTSDLGIGFRVELLLPVKH